MARKEDKSELLTAVNDWWFCAYLLWISPQSSSGAPKDLDSATAAVKMISASWWMLPLLLYKQVSSCLYLTPSGLFQGVILRNPPSTSRPGVHHIHHQRKGNHTHFLDDFRFSDLYNSWSLSRMRNHGRWEGVWKEEESEVFRVLIS